jgi:aminomethyltransferase
MGEDLNKTPFYDMHLKNGAKMVPFAGYDMPVQYPLGVMKEHQHTRTKAGLFDVSHMGQVILRGSDYDTAARALETLIPMDVQGLAQGRQRYGFFTNDAGGILEDLMFANRGDHIFMVVNAACKTADIVHLRAHLEPEIHVKEITNRALLALQGPMAEAVLAEHYPPIVDMKFMDVDTIPIAGAECWVSRSGYTGEDGFEISIPHAAAETVAAALADHADVEWIGLGARDSLRLEAGLCLYGHDIDTATTPVEAALTWAIQKSRRAGGSAAGGFPGDRIILDQLAQGVLRKRVGLTPQTRAPMRAGVILYASEDSSTQIGTVTSGGFGPTVGTPVAMGYVDIEMSATGTVLFGEVRGKRLPIAVSPLPHTLSNFKR